MKMNTNKKIVRKNEIYSKCKSCETKYLMAYWDYELECFIYLFDELKICDSCSSLKVQTINIS